MSTLGHTPNGVASNDKRSAGPRVPPPGPCTMCGNELSHRVPEAQSRRTPARERQKGVADMVSANISKEGRKAIYKRDGYRCALCDSTKYLQIHHYAPGWNPWFSSPFPCERCPRGAAGLPSRRWRAGLGKIDLCPFIFPLFGRYIR